MPALISSVSETVGRARGEASERRAPASACSSAALTFLLSLFGDLGAGPETRSPAGSSRAGLLRSLGYVPRGGRGQPPKRPAAYACCSGRCLRSERVSHSRQILGHRPEPLSGHLVRRMRRDIGRCWVASSLPEPIRAVVDAALSLWCCGSEEQRQRALRGGLAE